MYVYVSSSLLLHNPRCLLLPELLYWQCMPAISAKHLALALKRRLASNSLKLSELKARYTQQHDRGCSRDEGGGAEVEDAYHVERRKSGRQCTEHRAWSCPTWKKKQPASQRWERLNIEHHTLCDYGYKVNMAPLKSIHSLKQRYSRRRRRRREELEDSQKKIIKSETVLWFPPPPA